MTLKSDAALPPPWSAPQGNGAVASTPDAAVGREEDSLKAQSEGTTVAEVMSRGIVCIAADASLERVTEMLLERDIGSAPVVDAAWRPVGMISKTDLLQVLPQRAGRPAGEVLPDTSVGDVAQGMVLSVHETSPVSMAAALMASEGVHRLPVVDGAGEVVGVVSSLDLVRWVARCTNEAGSFEPS